MKNQLSKPFFLIKKQTNISCQKNAIEDFEAIEFSLESGVFRGLNQNFRLMLVSFRLFPVRVPVRAF